MLTSHLPSSGAGLAMLQTAIELQYFDDVICVYDPTQTGRLAASVRALLDGRFLGFGDEIADRLRIDELLCRARRTSSRRGSG